MDLLNQYFQAWNEKDLTKLSKVMHPNFLGIRTLDTERFFNLQEISDALMNASDRTYSNIEYEIQNQIVYAKASVTIKNQIHQIILKFLLRDELIYKVYEVLRNDHLNRFKLMVSYDGSMFDGYQRQPHQVTVQGSIEQALKDALHEDITVHGSGRTDKGVHAYHQVIHFDTTSSIEAFGILQMIRMYLPKGIFIESCTKVNETFHSRYDIKSKEYVYVINTKGFDVIKQDYEWYPGEFDENLFKSSLEQIKGTHDFTSFTKTNDSDKVRTIYDVRFVKNDHHLEVYIKGSGFLRYMVRNLIAAAMTISQGKCDYTMEYLLKHLDNNTLKDIAPAQGLYMNKVEYFD